MYRADGADRFSVSARPQLATAALSWVLTRDVLAPLPGTVVIPSLGVFGVVFSTAYAGLM